MDDRCAENALHTWRRNVQEQLSEAAATAQEAQIQELRQRLEADEDNKSAAYEAEQVEYAACGINRPF